MPKPKAHGFNKEKALLIIGLAALLGGAWWFWSTCPDSLQVAKALSTTEPPAAFKEINTQALEPLDQVLSRQRKSPFTPGGYLSERVAVRNQPLAPPEPPPPPPPPKRLPRKAEAMRPTDKDLEVKYMGVIHLDGKVYALLSTKDGVLRVKEGDVLKEQNYKIGKIDRQTIEVTDEEGKPWVLKDGAFDPANSSAGSGTGNGTGGNTKPNDKAAPDPTVPNPPGGGMGPGGPGGGKGKFKKGAG